MATVQLVDVGISPVLRTPQYIDARGVPNLHAARRAFEERWRQPLAVVEGARSRVRQRALWADYVAYLNSGPWAPRAATLFNSIHDEETRALAIDLGSGLANASDPRAQWARANFPRFGVHPTGYGFGEPWHYDIRPGTQTVALAGFAAPAAITPTEIEDDDLYNDTDRARDNLTHAAAARMELSLWTLGRTLNRIEATGDLNKWALTDENVGARRLLGDLGKAVAAIQTGELDTEGLRALLGNVLDLGDLPAIADAAADEQERRELERLTAAVFKAAEAI